MPSMPDMRRSVITSSGLVADSLAKACSALSAGMGSKPAVCRRMDNKRNKCGSSSTIRILVRADMSVPRCRQAAQVLAGRVAAALAVAFLQALLDAFQPFYLLAELAVFGFQPLYLGECGVIATVGGA